VLLKI